MGIQDAGLTATLLRTVVLICVGPLQFGYHMSELNAPESIISCRASVPGNVKYVDSWFGKHGFKKCIPMSIEQFSFATSIFSVGGMVGSFFAGRITDTFGRRKCALMYSTIFLAGSALEGLSNDYIGLLIGRLSSGIAAGIALVVSPMFINEIAPTKCRGFLGTMYQVFINLGILITQSLSVMWTDNNHWRLILLASGMIALFHIVVTAACVQESPRWLAANNRRKEACLVLQKLRKMSYNEVNLEVASWSQISNSGEVELLNQDTDESTLERGEIAAKQKTVSVKEFLTAKKFVNPRTVGTGMFAFQQFCGINSIVFYGVSVLVSLVPNKAILINVIISTLNLIMTLCAAPLIEMYGRKRMLLLSVSFMGLLTASMALGVIFTLTSLLVSSTFTYIIFFALGLGPIPPVILNEVTQVEAKGAAQSWGTTINWVATFIVGYLFPILKDKFLGGAVYFVFTAMCIAAFAFIVSWVPETKGLSTYEEIWRIRNS